MRRSPKPQVHAHCGAAVGNATANLPWSIWNGNAEQAHLFHEFGESGVRKLRTVLSGLRGTAQTRLQQFGHEKAQALFRHLTDAGLQANELGLDWSEYLRGHEHDDQHLQHMIDQAFSLLVGPDAEREQVMWHCDAGLTAGRCSQQTGQKVHAAAAHDARAVRLLQRLQRNGFVAIDDWGLDMDALEAQSQQALRAPLARALKTGNERFFSKTRERLPALNPLLQNRSLHTIVSGYLGGVARYDLGDNLLHYPAQFRPLRRLELPASEWHHDRCASMPPSSGLAGWHDKSKPAQ